MFRNVGKSMQILALMMLPAAMLMQLTAELRYGVSVMLLMMLFGIALFGLGRIVEGYGSPRAE